MKQADQIREFVLTRYVTPARAAGTLKLVVRAGDVHNQMGLSNAMPSVCNAISGRKLHELAGIVLRARTGPANGSNVYFEFDLAGGSRPTPPLIRDENDVGHRQPPTTAKSIDLQGAVALVSCVKTKRRGTCAARTLYTSAWFSKVRDLVESRGDRWFVLSAKYGLVAPDQPIASYELTLNSCGVAERREWASKVLEKLLPELSEGRRVVMFAGRRYREFLIQPLLDHGIKVEVPMLDLRQGEQLAWLSQQR